jgi:hypothetical protein
MADGQSVSLSWFQATSGDHDQIFITVRQLQVCSANLESESELLYDWRFTANQFIWSQAP